MLSIPEQPKFGSCYSSSSSRHSYPDILMKRSPIFLSVVIAVMTLPARAGLVAHWPLDVDARDATGNGHDGAVDGNSVSFGTPGANASTGNGATFSGNGHIDIPWSEALNPGAQQPDGSGSFTLALWARPTSVGGSHRSPFTSREDNGSSVNGPIIYIEPNGNWSFWAGNNGPSGAWNPIPAGPAVADTWVHVAIVYDADSVTRKMYLDGEEVINQPGGISANAVRDTHIGGGADDGNSFTWAGDIDDVGFWDSALTPEEIQNVMTNGVDSGPVVPDPRLRVTTPQILPFNGGVQQFDIAVSNAGATKNLTVTGATFAGANAAGFSLVSLPPAMPPGGTGVVKISFNPQGATGDVEAVMQLASNDPADPARAVTLRGTIHDPQVSADAALDFGTLPIGSAPVQRTLAIRNAGGSRPLEIAGVTVSGALAANFTVTAFPATLAPGAAGTVNVTFDRMGGDGFYAAQMEITTNDPLRPSIVVPLKAQVTFVDPLIAWWPLDTDATDATGNGFDGVVIEPILFEQEGANAATGKSAYFEGGGHIDVPFDPRLNPGVQAPNGSGSFTVTLWAFPTAVGDGQYHSPFTAREEINGRVNGPIIYNTFNGRWEYWAGNNGPSGAWNPFDGGPVIGDTWVHVAITYDADTTTRKMFLDGVEVINQVLGVSANTSRDLHIGAGQDDGLNFPWIGRLDDVGLFRKALSQEEIQQVMTGGVGSLSTPPPTTPFAITNLTGGPASGQVTLTWSSTAGTNYRVQRSTNLAAWTPVGSVVPGTGATTSFTDSALPAGSPGVFYRVQVVP